MFEENAEDAIETETQTTGLLDQRNSRLVQPLQSRGQTRKLDHLPELDP
jgi:hypothetical protein